MTVERPAPISFTPIGVVRSPFNEKVEAPRQATVARGVEARIELYPEPGIEHALEDLMAWKKLWVLFVFDRVTSWKPKVLPPRSTEKRGLFATRSPHRPNPIGMSAVSLAGVEGLVIHIRDVDILDGTPVLDVKPYVPWADSFPDAGDGWLSPAADPTPSYEIAWSETSSERLAWLAARGADIREPIEQALSLGPAPHPYRRIRRDGTSFRLAWKEWRVRFAVEGKRVQVLSLISGYRPRELSLGQAPVLHRDFTERFPSE